MIRWYPALRAAAQIAIVARYPLEADERGMTMTTDMATGTSGPKLDWSIGMGWRLSLMMFLQYAIWGAWLPLLWSFLQDYRGFTGTEIGWMFTAGGVGAIFGPFIAGQIADRWFNTERYLGISHIAGAVVVWYMADVSSFWGFLSMAIVYSLIYSPTIALTNSLSFHHMPNRDRDFGWVRLWGTVGWIAVGIGIGQWLLYHYTPEYADAVAKTAKQAMGMQDAFRLSAILGVIMGLYCFTLPRTPPQKGQEKFAFAETLKEVRVNPLLTLFLIAVPVSMIHQFYFMFTAPFLGAFQNQAGETADAINTVFGVGGGGLMTIGQMAEILVLFLIPFVAAKWSRKSLLVIGLCAYAARMFLFSQVEWLHAQVGIPPLATLITGVSLHGLCFGCFIFVAFMVVDEETSNDVKATAQNLFNLVIVGIGVVVGSIVSGWIHAWSQDPVIEGGIALVGDDGKPITVTNWIDLFSVPMYAALACLVLMLIFYPGRKASA
ncbi:MAG: MFS transporter [Phycisphaerales bacterium]|nr:MFS transporter [Phycisphaerales bacterium]